jgi:ferredoxin-NADP reductase
VSGEHFAPAHVRSVTDVASDVRLIEFVPLAGIEHYPTGSHIDVAVTIGGLPDTRSYSLVGQADRDAYRIAVKDVLDSRGGSRFMRSLQPSAEIAVSAPKSHFELGYGRPEYLLIAGGIGITPIIGMAQALQRYGRPFRLLYSVRTRDQLAFAQAVCGGRGGELTSARRSTACIRTGSSTYADRWA